MTEYYLCILDFEATCWENSSNKEKELMEIIEFPSVLYKISESASERETTSCVFISEFAEYVKPVIKPTLSAFCTELTGITQATVDAADVFENVYKRHIKWLNIHVPPQSKFVIGTCGNWDLATQLPREIRNKKLKPNKYYQMWINVKTEFEQLYRIKAKGMEGMLNYLQMELTGRHHSGIDDTRNIAKIMLKIIEDGKQHHELKTINHNNTIN